jgi:hypothetical protein
VTISYHGRRFRPIVNDPAGDVSSDTLFHYRQEDDVVWATYAGGAVRFGTLIATVDGTRRLDMRYQQVASDGTVKGGRCISTPEVLPDGRLRLHESWNWTEGGDGSGTSVIEEMD